MTEELKWPYNLKAGDPILKKIDYPRRERAVMTVESVTEKTIVLCGRRYRKDLLLDSGDFRYGITEATEAALEEIRIAANERRDRAFVFARTSGQGGLLSHSKILKIREIIEQEE